MGMYETHKELRIQSPGRSYGNTGAKSGYLASFCEFIFPQGCTVIDDLGNDGLIPRS